MKLHRTNINLYEEDIKFLESYHGYGWSNMVREILHDRVVAMKIEAATQKETQNGKWRSDIERY